MAPPINGLSKSTASGDDTGDRGTVAWRARQYGTSKPDADWESLDATERNTALSRHRRLHPWTRNADKEQVQSIVAMLIAKNSPGIRRRTKAPRLGSPDVPTAGS